MSTAGARGDNMTCSTTSSSSKEVSHARGTPGETLCHLYTLLGVHDAIFIPGAVIWSRWLTRFMHGYRSPKHDKVNPSITELYLHRNRKGDDGARALANAVKAIRVRWF